MTVLYLCRFAFLWLRGTVRLLTIKHGSSAQVPPDNEGNTHGEDLSSRGRWGFLSDSITVQTCHHGLISYTPHLLSSSSQTQSLPLYTLTNTYDLPMARTLTCCVSEGSSTSSSVYLCENLHIFTPTQTKQ